jgi:predicted deacylase
MTQSTSTVVELGPGRSRRFAPITTLASGFELGVTIHVIQGAKPGPAVGVSAMIHGDELDGLLIARELVRTLDPSALRGSVWILVSRIHWRWKASRETRRSTCST